MQIIPFPAHYQSVYTHFDISSFSLISCNTKVWFLQCKSMVFAMQEVGFWNANTGLLQNVDVQIMVYSSMAGYLFRGLNNCN